MHVQEMYRRLTGLVVFRRLLQDPVVAACGEMLSARVRGDSGDFSAACAGFEAALFQSSDSWSCYLREAVLESENVCIRGQAVGRSSVLQESLRRELAFFDCGSLRNFWWAGSCLPPISPGNTSAGWRRWG